MSAKGFAVVLASSVTWAGLPVRFVRGPLGHAVAFERVVLREGEAGRLGQGDAV